MDLLLINPPKIRLKFNISGIFPMPPLGLASIAAYVRKKGMRVAILDMPALKIGEATFCHYMQKNDYSCYGISCNITNLLSVFHIARLIKKYKPKATVLIGGPGSVIGPELIFKSCREIDIVVRGEGEQTTCELCEAINARQNIAHVKGITFRSNGSSVTTPDRPWLDLNTLLMPARDLLPNHVYRMHPPFGLYPKVTLAETSRGCDYGCTFCTFDRREVSYRSIDGVVEEIKELKADYAVNEIHFVDPNFTSQHQRVERLCRRLLNKNIRMHWTCKTRVDLVNKELLRLMKDAGCYMISYGIESGSQEILDRLNKRITLQDTIDAFRAMRQVGMRSIAYVLIGAPKENDNTIKDTITFVKNIRPDFVLYNRLLPDPNAVLTKATMRSEHVTAEDVFNFYTTSTARINNWWGLNSAQVERWLSKANRVFYFNPGYIFERLCNMRNMRDFFNMIHGAFFLIAERLGLSNLAKVKEKSNQTRFYLRLYLTISSYIRRLSSRCLYLCIKNGKKTFDKPRHL